MQQAQQNIPLILNLDKSRKRLTEQECFFLLNHDRNLGMDGTKRGTLGDTSPMAANVPACELELPTGENFAVKSFYSKLTNELYSWIYNSNGVHFIQRINGDGECQIVYHGDCLEIDPDPRHEITELRAYLLVEKLCSNRDGKTLVWTNGKHAIGWLDTEASIATEYFTTPFFDRCSEGCDFLQMCVPNPCACLVGEWMDLNEIDRGKTNNLLDVGVKLSFQWEYYDGRKSLWADPSKLFFQDTKGCFEDTSGFPRCLKVRVPIGNPLVDKIHIAYWKNGVWYQADTIEKYKKYNSSQQKWYERGLAELTNYSDDDCSFDYIFCNDKQCDTIEANYFNRVYNPIPIKPQGILPIGIGEDKTALGFYNYDQGNCPIDKTEVEKVSATIDCPDTNCKPELATVKVYAIIHNRRHNRNQFIYRMNGAAPNSPDDKSDPAYFGGLNDALSGGIETGYDQNFNDETRNFLPYIEGFDIYGEMKQYKSSAFLASRELWGTLANMDDVQTRNRWRRALRNGEFFFQYVELKVIKGSRGFVRLASHHATGLEPNTSTFVIGTQNLYAYKGDSDLSDQFTEHAEEVYFDTCNGDVDLSNQAFVIDDNAVDSGVSNKASAFYGYLKSSEGVPVEGAIIEIEGFDHRTDHNGFYHGYLEPGEDGAKDAFVRVEQDCHSFATIQTESVDIYKGTNTSRDINLTNTTYNTTFYAKVNVKVQDCDGLPIAGVRVALSGSKYVATEADGYARFKIRNYITRDRDLRFVVLNNKGCFITDCNGVCGPCMPTGAAGASNCFQGIPVITPAPFTVNTQAALENRKGLKAGGRYPIGFVVEFGCGKISGVNEIGYLDVPKTQQKDKEGFCSFAYNMTGLQLPTDATCIKLVRGQNVNPFELQWVVDKVERIDGKIRLTIQSLNDYNAKYFFKTNTIYQWLKGDRVEFIKNGDGKIFSTINYGLLNYLTLSPFHDEDISGEEDAPADFFNQLLIDDDGRLDTLTEGAVIELQRSKECTTDPVYYTFCVNIPVVDGQPLYPVGVFNTFDTYYVTRNIGTRPPQQFEHHSPSDFWGVYTIDGANYNLNDLGKPHFVNKYENLRRFGRNITINAPGEPNFFGHLVKTLDPDGHGDITGMVLIDNKIGLCISEYDNSLFEVGDDLLKVGGDGIVRAATSDSVISDSQPKISGSYGCQYPHIGSILVGDGYVSWVDVKRKTHVIHDYQQAKPADEGKAQTYFSRRCQQIETNNGLDISPLDKLRFATGRNLASGAIFITIKALRDPGIYNEIAPFKKQYDTIAYDPASGDYLSFESFVPEAYGELHLSDTKGCAFVCFLGAVPYINQIIPDKWNEYFGVAVDWVIGISINKFPEKRKSALALEEHSDDMFYVAEVTTSEDGYLSEIPPKRFERRGKIWNASYMGNKNSRAGLFGSEQPYGFNIDVTFIRDNTDGLKVNTFDSAKRTKYGQLSLILNKFFFQEQSGFTANL